MLSTSPCLWAGTPAVRMRARCRAWMFTPTGFRLKCCRKLLWRLGVTSLSNAEIDYYNNGWDLILSSVHSPDRYRRRRAVSPRARPDFRFTIRSRGEKFGLFRSLKCDFLIELCDSQRPLEAPAQQLHRKYMRTLTYSCNHRTLRSHAAPLWSRFSIAKLKPPDRNSLEKTSVQREAESRAAPCTQN